MAEDETDTRRGPKLKGEEKRKRYNIVLEPSFHAEAMTEANRRGISLSQLIEDALREQIESDAEEGVKSAQKTMEEFLNKHG